MSRFLTLKIYEWEDFLHFFEDIITIWLVVKLFREKKYKNFLQNMKMNICNLDLMIRA